MPHYYNPQGQIVSAADAMNPNRSLKDGYRVTLAPGERATFDMALMDSAPLARTSVFMTDTNRDTSLSDEARGYVVAKAKASHNRKFAYLGDRAPEFTDAMANASIAREIESRRGATAFAAQYAADTQRLQDERKVAEAGLKTALRNRHR